MKDKWKVYEEYLKQAVEECRNRERQLIGEERKDEANLCRIQENIFGIFQSFMEVAAAKAPDDREDFIRSRAANVMAAWQKSYEKAKSFGDAEKMLIEEIKLKAAKCALAELPKGEEA